MFSLKKIHKYICSLLQRKREALPDVPAVYFVSPTDENVAVIEVR